MNDAQMFQAMDGFGYCLRSAQLLHQLALGARAHLLRKLFATDGPNLGVSYLRLNIVVSALDAQVFSHNDRPAGEIAPTLTSLTSSRACLSLVLKNLIYQS